MNHCAIQQNAFSNWEENRNSVSIPISERRNPVACPIPRRLGLLSDHPSRSLRFQFSHQSELCDSIAGTDFLEIILTKGYGMDNQSFCKQEGGRRLIIISPLCIAAVFSFLFTSMYFNEGNSYKFEFCRALQNSNLSKQYSDDGLLIFACELRQHVLKMGPGKVELELFFSGFSVYLLRNEHRDLAL
ncbi:hypothetical protein OIU84_021229 [Salix udensis]|uniref:Uncharacterized protein n=1 Tax=Salix udensis TaxID=889485 RepID=A0AAD6KU65_9ROSI|nr:hypothetical protein OIU84_021229 [Salix udensis]